MTTGAISAVTTPPMLSETATTRSHPAMVRTRVGFSARK